ncbi:MAG: diguanylate cyclase [Terracidiphilus sp.]
MAFSVAMQAQQYVFQAYRQREGLQNLAVNALTTDSEGFLWVATENGVYRFLGSIFEPYGKDQGIFERDIEDVYADPSGIIWAGTVGNLYHWDGQRFLAVSSNPIQIRGAQRLVAEDARHLLVVDNGRLYRLEHDTQGRMISYTPVFSGEILASNPALNHLSSVSNAGGQTIWMGCGTMVCSWFDGPGGAVTQWGTEKGVPKSIWHSFAFDHSGTLWVAGQQHNVVFLARGATRFVDRSFPGPDPNSIYQHSALVVDQAGRVIVCAEGGVARWEGKSWRLIDPSIGLHTGHITSLVVDATGDLWLGSFGHGLYHWVGPGEWEGWSDLQGLPSADVLSFSPLRDDRVLVGTEKGPGWANPKTGLAGSLIPGQKWTYGQVSAIGTNRDGTVWAGTFSGAVLRIDPKTGRVNETAKLPSLIEGAVQDSAGRIIFSTDGGLYEREAGALNASPHRIAAVDALVGDSTKVDMGCVAPDGVVWFLAQNRLLREQDGQWTFPPIDGFPRLNGSLVYLSCGANGEMWATGQHTGILRLTPSGSRIKAWKLPIPSEFGALSPLAILADRRGWVWLGSDWGLAVWNGREWRHLTQESGLLWNDLNRGTLTNGLDGTLWIETSGGLAHLIHPERVFDSTALPVSVTSIERNNQALAIGGPIVLPWSQAPLQFDLSSPALRGRSELLFKYRMDGLQTDWIEGRNGIAVFSALPPGEYTFMVLAHNPGLNLFSPTVKVKVQILPPWWRSYWFYALCGLAFLLLLAGSIHLYVRYLRATSRQLELLVSERTRELEISREQLRIQATHDGLTGMLNRVAILRALATEMERARRDNRTVVMALIDLDYFKHVNDTYGHLAGDDALRRFAAAVGTAVRPYDHAGRYGGEEFLLVLTEVPRDIVEQRLAALHHAISNLEIALPGSSYRLNCSVGATVFDPSYGPASVETLLAIADKALYAAKAEGRNRVVFYHPSFTGASPESDPKLPNPR